MSVLILTLHHLHQFAEKIRILIYEKPDLSDGQKWCQVRDAYRELLQQLRPHDLSKKEDANGTTYNKSAS